MQHFLVFGRLPWLSLAESKAVLGGEAPLMADALAVFERDVWDAASFQDRLAGTVKLGDVILDLPVQEFTPERLADEIGARPRGKKIEFGLTFYGGSGAAKAKVKHFPLQLKRVLKERGHSVRWVTGEKGEITPAAVAKTGLTDQGYDFCVGIFGTRVVVGLTTHVQNADDWSRRDYGRPFRDEVTGMLPPKLARALVNLAVDGKREVTILDPFCGGGTVLMEAALLNQESKINDQKWHMIGSDIDRKQVEGAKENLKWLGLDRIEVFQYPAERIHEKVKRAEAIVTEGYLGRPLTGQETLATLMEQKQEIEDLWRTSFRSFARIQKKGDRVVCVWPVFVSSHGTVAVDLREELKDFWYRWIDPLEGWVKKPMTLTYSREGQRVKRNIVVLERE